MKKLIVPFVFVCSFLFMQGAFSQVKKSPMSGGEGSPMEVGSVFVNAGFGVGADYKYSYGTGFGFKFSAEFGLWQAGPGVITLGPEIGGSFSTGYNGFYTYDNYKSNTFIVAARSAWHYGWGVPKLDTYGGVSAGIGFNHYSYYYNNDYTSNQVIPAFGVFIGGSYFINPNFGFTAETGYDITYFQVGVVFKIQ
jgi:hypothetical protein